MTIDYSDGYACHARRWNVPRPVAAVVYLHGIQSHGGWYESSAQALADAGCAVLMPDRRGSGANAKDRGHAPSVDRLLKDLFETADRVQQSSGQSRVHIVGVSWGGKLAVAAALAQPQRITGLSLIAPGLFPRVGITPKQKLQIAYGLLFNRRRAFRIPLGEPALFTDNPEQQAYIANDDLSLCEATASFGWVSRKLDAVRTRAVEQLRAPTRAFLAGRDRIIDTEATKRWVRSLIACPDRAVIEYPHAAHSLEFEPDPSAFFADLTQWVLTTSAGINAPAV